MTWWAGVFALCTGLAQLFMADAYAATQIGLLVSMLAGGADASPAANLSLGLGLIGARAAIARGFMGNA